MKIAVVGPLDGNIEELYRVLTQNPPEVEKGIDWILCTGNFGIWPDPKRIDKATREKGGVQDFAELYLKGWQCPIPTVFVSGAHEDHIWLEQRKKWENGAQILEGLHWLMNGYKTIIGDYNKEIRVTGLGKVYSEATFNGRWNKRSKRHYTRRELEKGCSSGPTDLLLLHEKPANPIRNLIYATRPKLVFHSSPQRSKDEIQGIPIIGLPKRGIEILDV